MSETLKFVILEVIQFLSDGAQSESFMSGASLYLCQQVVIRSIYLSDDNMTKVLKLSNENQLDLITLRTFE